MSHLPCTTPWAASPLLPTALILPRVSTPVHAGFPSPAEDLPTQPFDLMAHIAPHPISTFTLRVRGDSMRDAGIPDGCLITVDRAISPQHGHMVVAIVDGEFTIKQLYQRNGRCELHPANPAFAPIVLHDLQELQVWGVVTASVIEHLPRTNRSPGPPAARQRLPPP